MVGFAVELDQLDIELGAHGAHGGFGEGEHWIGEQFASELCVGTWSQRRLSQRVHRCGCGITADRDLFSAY
ncbi:hypothetical protein, partial [Mycobacterium sp.]|uniref:hypothetical protein n=1 Tax=Mycobacterium sp. TaxID=1785 RepID=UPI0031E096C4